MAKFHNRSGEHGFKKKGHAAASKAFINKADAERLSEQVEIEMQKGNYTNLVLAKRRTFAEIMECHITEVLPTIRGDKADFLRGMRR